MAKIAKKPKTIQLENRDDEFEDIDQKESEYDLKISGKDFEDIVVAPSDWTLGSLIGLIGKQIKLDPEFQRRGVWSEKAKIKFIESLFLNVPIPQILLAPRKEDKNSYLILDGKQRLLTIKEFSDGQFESGRPFALKGLRLLKELEDKTWREIRASSAWENRFLNQTQRAAVLKAWKKEDVLYEIFHRLNSGSVGLSPMELRMSLHRGEFLRFLIQWSETVRELHHLLRLSRPDKRMSDVELALRFLAFADKRTTYKGNLKVFLDDATLLFNREFRKQVEQARIETTLKNMEAGITAAMSIFEPRTVCRKWKDGDYESRFNRAVFDVVIGSLANARVRSWALSNKGEFEKLFVATCRKDREFVSALETTTKSTEAVRKRFSTWYSAINKASRVKLELPYISE